MFTVKWWSTQNKPGFRLGLPTQNTSINQLWARRMEFRDAMIAANLYKKPCFSDDGTDLRHQLKLHAMPPKGKTQEQLRMPRNMRKGEPLLFYNIRTGELDPDRLREKGNVQLADELKN